MKNVRKRLFALVDPAEKWGKIDTVYDLVMMLAIIVSIVPLAFKENYPIFVWFEYVTVSLFILDYLLRWVTADYKLGKGALSFVLYPITPFALIDLLSILPSLTVLNNGFRLLRLFRLLKTLKVLRTFKFLRYTKSFEVIVNVFKKQRKILLAVATTAVAYILISALAVYTVEPATFDSFLDAIYWATISLTTVGYGDIYPVTTVGKIVTMLSSVLGIAVIALPSGVITAGYMAEINKKDEKKSEKKDESTESEDKKADEHTDAEEE